MKNFFFFILFFSIPGLVYSQSVETGAQVLIEHHLDELKGKKVGLVMNSTARVEGTHMLDTLLALGVDVTALFSPEHGFRGEYGAGEMIQNGVDQASGLPVFSLYGDTKKPTPKMLQQVDLLLFDMQGVGARFYTYISTLGLVLEAAAESNIPIWILDRPNPAGGQMIAGWLMREKHRSFVGAYPIPMVHGLTIGELAKMMIGEHWIDFNKSPNLRIIKMKNWKRSTQWPETGLPWIPPSPNLPTFEHAFAYLGTVLFEGTTISEGRGSADPFLTVGSPSTHISKNQLQKLRAVFPAASIKKIAFTPKAIPGTAPEPKFKGQKCYGIKFRIKDYKRFSPVAFGVALLKVMLNATDNAEVTDYMELLTGIDNEELLNQLKERSYKKYWQQTEEVFAKKRREYLLYKCCYLQTR
ncbi:MAG TPA: DUF1343 domain-containing protein [Balneolaceae bacterium]|nr:DUF1343 domain-containing protein [Balneolaceae bacterium]